MLTGIVGVSVNSLDMYHYLFSVPSLDSSQEATLSFSLSSFSQSLPLFMCREHVPVRTGAISWPLSRVLHPFCILRKESHALSGKGWLKHLNRVRYVSYHVC